MADIKRLLNKKGWTGRELGILELTNMAIMFRQAIEGKPQKPLIEEAQFRKMINAITDRQQGLVYNGYISIHEWLSVRYNIAQTQLQQAQLQYRTLSGYITNAILAEDVFRYIEKLPAIMTQKQYDDIKAERIEAHFKDEQGNELYTDVFNLIERAITYYLHQLQKEPSKANPLKAIRKKYVNQPVKSELILSRWNKLTGAGYYTIEDGSGRRSDTMSREEWIEAMDAPYINKALRDLQATDGEGTKFTRDIATRRLIERAKVIFNGGTEEDADKAQHERDIKEGLHIPVKWHYYETPPTDLMKWDVIEQEFLLELYPFDFEANGNEYSESNFTKSMEDFKTEFSELVTVILKDIDKRFFKNEQGLSNLPISEWATNLYDFRQLYEKDFYGERATVESDTTIFDGNQRALFNGIAILRASDLLNRSPRINDKGYYVEPDIRTTLSNFTLEAFFPEAKEYADNIDIVETSRQTLIESYYHIKGYNLTLQLIADYYDVPDITVFDMDVEGIEDKIEAFNELVPILYKKIVDTDYGDKELKDKKLHILKELFQPIAYKDIIIPEDNISQAKELLVNFAAFKPANSVFFNSLLCTLPQENEDNGEEE